MHAFWLGSSPAAPSSTRWRGGSVRDPPSTAMDWAAVGRPLTLAPLHLTGVPAPAEPSRMGRQSVIRLFPAAVGVHRQDVLCRVDHLVLPAIHGRRRHCLGILSECVSQGAMRQSPASGYHCRRRPAQMDGGGSWSLVPAFVTTFWPCSTRLARSAGRGRGGGARPRWVCRPSRGTCRA